MLNSFPSTYNCLTLKIEEISVLLHNWDILFQKHKKEKVLGSLSCSYKRKNCWTELGWFAIGNEKMLIM